MYVHTHAHFPPASYTTLENAFESRWQLVCFLKTMLITFDKQVANLSDKFTFKATQRGDCINDINITNGNRILHQIILICCYYLDYIL